MAKPIEIKPQPGNARDELQRRLGNAPMEHADALLALYDLLQKSHDSGTLDLLRGVLGAGDEVLNHLVGLLTKQESVRGIQNLLVLGKLLASLDPELLSDLTENLPEIVEQASADGPPSLLALARRFRSKESRRALAAGAAVLESIGRGLDRGAK